MTDGTIWPLYHARIVQDNCVRIDAIHAVSRTPGVYEFVRPDPHGTVPGVSESVEWCTVNGYASMHERDLPGHCIAPTKRAAARLLLASIERRRDQLVSEMARAHGQILAVQWAVRVEDARKS